MTKGKLLNHNRDIKPVNLREIKHAMGLEFRPVGGLMESQTSDKKVIGEVVFVIFREKGGFVQC